MKKAMNDTPAFWKKAKADLSKKDPILKKIISGYPGEILKTRGNGYQTLLRSIVGQQISVKAAQSIWARVEDICDTERPRSLLSLPVESLRACGLSGRKAEYVRDLAIHFDEGKVDPSTWPQKSDEELIIELTDVRGIGRWTAEMFLMFHLMRPDVFPVDDIGLQRAISIQYKKRYPPSAATLKKLGDTWRPWRSVATWYLWRSIDPVPVKY